MNIFQIFSNLYTQTFIYLNKGLKTIFSYLVLGSSYIKGRIVDNKDYMHPWIYVLLINIATGIGYFSFWIKNKARPMLNFKKNMGTFLLFILGSSLGLILNGVNCAYAAQVITLEHLIIYRFPFFSELTLTSWELAVLSKVRKDLLNKVPSQIITGALKEHFLHSQRHYGVIFNALHRGVPITTFLPMTSNVNFPESLPLHYGTNNDIYPSAIRRQGFSAERSIFNQYARWNTLKTAQGVPLKKRN